MAPQNLANTYQEITRLLGVAVPLVPDVFSGDTRVAGPWVNPPYDGHVPALGEHCLVRHISGVSDYRVKVDGNVRLARLLPGTLSLVPKGQESWRCSRSTVIVSNVYLGGNRLQACADIAAHGQRPELTDRVGFTDPRLTTIMTLLSDEVASGDSARLFIEQLIDLLCLQLLRLHSVRLAPGEILPRRGLAAWQVRRVTSYVRDHLDREMTLQELSDSVGLNRYYFCRAFRLATGCTPHEWVTRQRVARARELLASRELRIIDVALAVGYQTPSAFTASFRKVTGTTPSAFRRGL